MSPLPHISSWRGAQLIKRSDNFTSALNIALIKIVKLLKSTHTQVEALWRSCESLLSLILRNYFLTEPRPSTMEIRLRLLYNFYVVISTSNFAINLHIEEPHFNYENNLKRILPDLSSLKIFMAYGMQPAPGSHKVRAYILLINSVFITSFLPEIRIR
jgi:hypothetical protein